jgi:hypothetical protein
MHALARGEPPSAREPAAAAAGTIPVPPRVEGGWWRTIAATLALGVEVMLSMLHWLVRRAPPALSRASGKFLRGAGGVAAGLLRILLFVLLLFVLGAVVMLLVLLFVGARP